MTEQEELEKLRIFFIEVSKLTIRHNEENDKAVVYARDLGNSLIKVDPDWWKVFIREKDTV